MPEAEEMAVDGKEPITEKLSIQLMVLQILVVAEVADTHHLMAGDHAILPMVVLAL